ncbi:hypothetical protein O3P69_015948 [Scylla paramamosain]|uniref:Uncharacterized protein n=1 Tax=Scylla paramamosain TaxID=85552 RepID=A0AAW0T889_SCYPA
MYSLTLLRQLGGVRGVGETGQGRVKGIRLTPPDLESFLCVSITAETLALNTEFAPSWHQECSRPRESAREQQAVGRRRSYCGLESLLRVEVEAVAQHKVSTKH